ncbi:MULTISPECIES: hypothetical protein [Haloferax]|uniref:hypothetical protein n=1 Tax=Haloferax TaxID=2251 RepID=UPI001CD9811B|nr:MULTISPECIES: hypothetical protein [Haloferax]
MGRRRDAELALVVAIPVAVGVAVLRPPSTLSAILVGIIGALVVEALLLRARSRVRTLWDDQRVQVVAVVTTLVAVGVAVETVGASVLVLVLSGLVTYLLLLVGVELRDWQTGRP